MIILKAKGFSGVLATAKSTQAVLQVSDLRVLLQGRHSKRLSLLGMPMACPNTTHSLYVQATEIRTLCANAVSRHCDCWKPFAQ